jgi:hypothetical protein
MATRPRKDSAAIVAPRSTLSTRGLPIQTSARVVSIGSDVIENRPSNSPTCMAIRSALNATARTPGRKRWRSYQRVARE